jgi:hypothetical protein
VSMLLYNTIGSCERRHQVTKPASASDASALVAAK